MFWPEILYMSDPDRKRIQHAICKALEPVSNTRPLSFPHTRCSEKCSLKDKCITFKYYISLLPYVTESFVFVLFS